MSFKAGDEDALIVVDVQKDFCPGGTLPVPDGDRVVPILNQYIEMFRDAGASIFFTLDYHPPDHRSFISQGGDWPSHCVQGSQGAEFHEDLNIPKHSFVVKKGTEPSVEGYSALDGTGLKDMLEDEGVNRVFVGGLATDYCVKYTVLDALELGFEVVLLLDSVRGVNVEEGDETRAIERMIGVGCKVATLPDFQ